MIWQFVRFGLVGCVNTTIDLLVLNFLLGLWSAQGTARLLLFNTLAYACGALNSFVFNRYWTFRREGPPNAREGARFLLVTLAAIACNDLILWLMSNILHPAHLTPTLWTNVSKVVAIGGTILVSYLGMRLWVFVPSSHQKPRVLRAFFQRGERSPLPERTQVRTPISSSQRTTVGSPFTTHSLAVVLPAYNEEQVETRGAMINAELLYRLNAAGCTLREVEVRHLPRRGGRAKGVVTVVICNGPSVEKGAVRVKTPTDSLLAWLCAILLHVGNWR